MNFSTSHPDSSTAINDHESEKSSSENSFESSSDEESKTVEYESTNLITKPNITLADVICEVTTSQLIRNRHQALVTKCKFMHNPLGIIDPRAILKEKKKKMPVLTLLKEEEVLHLAQLAVEVRCKFDH